MIFSIVSHKQPTSVWSSFYILRKKNTCNNLKSFDTETNGSKVQLSFREPTNFFDSHSHQVHARAIASAYVQILMHAEGKQKVRTNFRLFYFNCFIFAKIT